MSIGTLGILAAVVANVAVAGYDRAVQTTNPPAGQANAQPVQIEMRNVRLHVADGVTLSIRALRGEMIARDRQRPPVFDDPRSYVLEVAAAEVSLDMASLNVLMNRYAFGGEKAALRNVRVRALADGRLEQKGTLHKGIGVPVAMKASVGVTREGAMRLRVDSIKAVGIPAKGLMNLFGLEVDDVLSLKDSRGVEVRDNDVIVSPGQVLPPPEMRGRLVRAALERGRLVQVFGGGPSRAARKLKPPAPRAANYIYFSGGVITFGKLTMTGADLQLIDLDPRDPFDFNVPQYNRQLVAGYSKNTPQHGLKTYMPDFEDVRVRDATRLSRR